MTHCRSAWSWSKKHLVHRPSHTSHRWLWRKVHNISRCSAGSIKIITTNTWWQTLLTEHYIPGMHKNYKFQAFFPCTATDPFQPCHRGRCRLDHCSWWGVGWQVWRALLHPHCPLSWSCWWTPHCSCHSRQTSRTNLSAYALNAGCVQPLGIERMTSEWINWINWNSATRVLHWQYHNLKHLSIKYQKWVKNKK